MMPNAEIIVVDSSDNEFEFKWEPDKAHDKVDLPDALPSFIVPFDMQSCMTPSYVPMVTATSTLTFSNG